MRVTITTVEDFCAELSREAAAGTVWRNQIRTRIDRGADQEPPISFTVAVWGTAIIKSQDGDYLMEYGEIVGRDDPDDEPKNQGTAAARQRVEMIREVAKNAGLHSLPGKFEVA